jgi:phosphoglycolate phosphatase
MKDAAILFDLDGTMVDSAPDLIRATNHTLNLYGFAPASAEVIRPAVSRGARAMIEAALGSAGHSAPDADLDRMFDVFLAHYEANIAVDSRPYPGFAQAAGALQAEGARLGVCTNKRHANAVKLLAELELEALFGAIAGRDTFSVYKPHPGHVLGTIAQLGGNPARAIMVGDSPVDGEAARAAGVPFIAVSFGYGDGIGDATDGADAVIASYAELLPAIRRLLRTA